MKDSNCASFHKRSEHKSHSYGEVPNLELGDPVQLHTFMLLTFILSYLTVGFWRGP